MDISSCVFLTLMVLLNVGTNYGVPNNVEKDVKCCPKNQVSTQLYHCINSKAPILGGHIYIYVIQSLLCLKLDIADSVTDFFIKQKPLHMYLTWITQQQFLIQNSKCFTLLFSFHSIKKVLTRDHITSLLSCAEKPKET